VKYNPTAVQFPYAHHRGIRCILVPIRRDGLANPHAVTQVANGVSSTTYSYNNNGNLISAGNGFMDKLSRQLSSTRASLALFAMALAAEAVARSGPDGYTLLVVPSAHPAHGALTTWIPVSATRSKQICKPTASPSSGSSIYRPIRTYWIGTLTGDKSEILLPAEYAIGCRQHTLIGAAAQRFAKLTLSTDRRTCD
jgi:hypothetical protein